jgi:hypothetical protein
LSQGSGFLDALGALQRALDGLGAPSMVIGGVAVIAHGVPRLTVDIDATIAADQVEPEAVARALAFHGIEPRVSDAIRFARDRHVFLAEHGLSGTPLDISFAWLPFEAEALAHGIESDFAGVRIRIPRVEDLVIYKLVASRPRDLDDVESLLLLHGGRISLGRIRRVVSEFAAVLEDAERPRVLEELLRKTGLSSERP